MDEMKLKISPVDLSVPQALPYSEEGVRAGFPSPAQDYMSGGIDLNKELVRHRETTFYARVSGHSMAGAGIEDGDLVVVDKSLEARTGDYVVACIDGDIVMVQEVLGHSDPSITRRYIGIDQQKKEKAINGLHF